MTSMLLLLCVLLYMLLLAQSFQSLSYTNTASSAHTAAQVAGHSSTRLYSSREDELRDKIAKLRKAQGQGKSYEAVMGYARSKFNH
jgi:hypothetical protein